jgi:hypothetical protein
MVRLCKQVIREEVITPKGKGRIKDPDLGHGNLHISVPKMEAACCPKIGIRPRDYKSDVCNLNNHRHKSLKIYAY